MLLGEIEKIAKDYGLKRLSAASGISRPHIHKIFSGRSSPSLETLMKILVPLGCSLKLKITKSPAILDLTTIEGLKFAMASYGAPFILSNEIIETHKNYALPQLETVLLQALRKGRDFAEINTVLPFFINSNLSDINLERLTLLFDDKQYLGYLLDLLYQLTNEGKYIMAISKLNIDINRLRPKILIKGNPKNKYQKAFFSKSINRAAENWKFSTGDSFNNIRQRFDKWRNVDLHKERP